MSGSGRLALLNVREWSRGPPGCMAVVGKPSQMSRSGQESFPDVKQWSGGPAGCAGVGGRPSSMSGSDGRPSRMF